MSYFTYHVRLTKYCNADCSYCSCWVEDNKRMSVDDFKKGFDFTIDLILNKLKLDIKFISIQYIGGEVLIIPESELREIVYYARERLKLTGIKMRDGVQTNLIGSPKKISFLKELFGNNIGTSIDTTSDKRTVNKSSDKYNLIFRTSEKFLNKKIPAIYTMDMNIVDNAMTELENAIKEDRDISFKGVFTGSRNVDLIDNEIFKDTMLEIMNRWLVTERIIVEPFYSMLKKHLQVKGLLFGKEYLTHCHFQNDCAEKSLNIDPDGSLYVCQDLSDMNKGYLGNCIDGIFDFDQWNTLKERKNNLNEDCIRCDYLTQCQGGCMVESLEYSDSYYNKPYNCSLWKSIFARFDLEILNNKTELLRWFKRFSIR